MGKMIQIRNVPPELHRTLKARAAMAGLSLSGYLLAEIRKSAERPTNQELIARLVLLSPVKVRTSPARAVRQARDRR
jgi:plasmid stability protein